MNSRFALTTIICSTVALVTALNVQGQTFEPLEGGINTEDAIALPPSPTVIRAQPLDATPGPAVSSNNPDNNPVSESTSQTVGGFESVETKATADGYPLVLPNVQNRQLYLQQQQLQRIEKVEEGLNKLVRKQSFSKSLMGTIISAATTADPVLAALGGVAGFLIGKAEDYKAAEKNSYELQQEILRKSPYFYTDEELKLAAYANTELDPTLMKPDQIETFANYVYEARTRSKAGDWPTNPQLAPEVIPEVVPEEPEVIPSAPVNPDYQLANFVVGGATPHVDSLADICSGYLRAAKESKQKNTSRQNVSVTSRRGANYTINSRDRRSISRYCFYSLR